jgi:hypothetical protein
MGSIIVSLVYFKKKSYHFYYIKSLFENAANRLAGRISKHILNVYCLKYFLL